MPEHTFSLGSDLSIGLVYYDLMICTSRISIKKAADLILEYVESVQENMIL